MILRRLGRVAAAAALVASSAAIATVASVAPASAADTAITWDCGNGSLTENIGNSDTLTITINAGSGCQSVVINGMGPNPPLGTASINGGPNISSGSPAPLQDGDVIVYTAPASGTDSDSLTFLSGGSPNGAIYVSFPQSSGSMVDNGDGTMTLTYDGSMLLFLAPEGTTCADPFAPFSTDYILTNSPGAPVPPPASPATIAVGTDAMAMGGPAAVPIVAGTYEACLYLGTSPNALEQAMTITIGQLEPTTTTTAGTDPVTPSFTG